MKIWDSGVVARGGFVSGNMLDNQYADRLCYLPLSLPPLLFDSHRCRSHHVYQEPHS